MGDNTARHVGGPGLSGVEHVAALALNYTNLSGEHYNLFGCAARLFIPVQHLLGGFYDISKNDDVFESPHSDHINQSSRV